MLPSLTEALLHHCPDLPLLAALLVRWLHVQGACTSPDTMAG